MFPRLLFILLAFFISQVSFAQTLIELSGVIRDPRQEPVSGATIRLLNTLNHTTSDVSGHFSFSNLPSGKYLMLVSKTGYANQLVELSENKTSAEIQLKEEKIQLPEVIVTAQKREEDLQRLPLSISGISEKQVKDYQLWNTKELSAIIPNMYSANPGDNRNVTSVRGIATTSYDQSVATYIDGVNQFGLDTYIAQLYDIDRIEVLRGPQGTLYGRNAMGGVINIITKKPDNFLHGFAELNYGNYGQQRYLGGIRTPLVVDRLFLGVTGLYNRTDGFYTNEFNNSHFDKQHNFAGNYDLKFIANDKLSFNLNVKHNQNRNNGTFPLVFGSEAAFSNPFKLNQNAVSEMVDNLFNSSLAINYYGSKVNFSSQSSYQSNNRYYRDPLDGDFSPLDAVSVINNYGGKWNKVKAGTQEFQLSSKEQSPIRWQTGAYAFLQDNPVKQGTYFGADAEMLGAPFPFFTSINTNSGKAYGYAVYGQAAYHLAPKLELVAGLRFDQEFKELDIRGEFQPEGGDLMVTQPDTSSKADFTAFSPKVSLSYEINERQNAFTSYSRGFRAGGISQLSSDPSQPALYNYDPEFSDNFEIGLKNTFFDKRLRLNLAAFYTRVNNAQVPTLILPEAITIVRNAGKLTSKGAELELSATLLKGLKADYNFGYTDAEYKTLLVASNGESVNMNGHKQVFSPDMTSMLALQYDFSLAKRNDINFFTRAEWKYLGDQYFDLANQIKQSGYSIINARAGVSVKNYSLSVWSNNLGDKHYLDYAYDFGAVHLGNPNTFGVTLRGQF